MTVRFLLAVLFVLAPGLAAAHGGHHSKEAPSAIVADVAPEPAADRNAGTISVPALSRSCPGSGGESCCCGPAVGCSGSGKVTLACLSDWILAGPHAADAL